jgi:uncharacterized membrane protein
MIDIIWSNKHQAKPLLRQRSSKESMSRSIVKAISWRILGTIDTVLIAFFMSGKWRLALSIGFAEWISKMILYILHERLWCNINWGVK